MQLWVPLIVLNWIRTTFLTFKLHVIHILVAAPYLLKQLLSADRRLSNDYEATESSVVPGRRRPSSFEVSTSSPYSWRHYSAKTWRRSAVGRWMTFDRQVPSVTSTDSTVTRQPALFKLPRRVAQRCMSWHGRVAPLWTPQPRTLTEHVCKSHCERINTFRRPSFLARD